MMVRKHFEVIMIKIARHILLGRNSNRCRVCSRRDNNSMWYMAEKLDAICERMLDEYKD